MKKSHKWLYLLVGILYFLGAYFVLTNPVLNLASLGIILSVSILVDGITQLVAYFSAEEKSGWQLANGIFAIIVGIWMLSGTMFELALSIPMIFAFLVLMASIMRLISGFEFNKVGLKEGGGLLIASGIIGIIIGFILLYHPLLSGSVVTFMVVAALIYQGSINIINFFKAFKKTDDSKEASETKEA